MLVASAVGKGVQPTTRYRKQNKDDSKRRMKGIKDRPRNARISRLSRKAERPVRPPTYYEHRSHPWPAYNTHSSFENVLQSSNEGFHRTPLPGSPFYSHLPTAYYGQPAAASPVSHASPYFEPETDFNKYNSQDFAPSTYSPRSNYQEAYQSPLPHGM